jgi:hypothetical protein
MVSAALFLGPVLFFPGEGFFFGEDDFFLAMGVILMGAKERMVPVYG